MRIGMQVVWADVNGMVRYGKISSKGTPDNGRVIIEDESGLIASPTIDRVKLANAERRDDARDLAKYATATVTMTIKTISGLGDYHDQASGQKKAIDSAVKALEEARAQLQEFIRLRNDM